MGSGISLSKEQIIQIIKRTLNEEFYLKESFNQKTSDDGFLLYENFDNEEEYYIKIRHLNSILRKYSEQ